MQLNLCLQLVFMKSFLLTLKICFKLYNIKSNSLKPLNNSLSCNLLNDVKLRPYTFSSIKKLYYCSIINY